MDRGEGRRRNDDRRARVVRPPKLQNSWLRSALKILGCIRDLIIFLAPASITRKIYKEYTFAFVTHPRDFDDIARHFPFAKFLPIWFLDFWLKHQWPVIGARITNLPLRGKGVQKGWLIFCPLTARQMIRNRALASRKVAKAVRFAEKLNARIVGLGAFTSIVTRDGLDLVGKVKTGITTGNALSAATAIQNAVKATQLTGRQLSELEIAIVGAAGNVGSGCARIMNGNVRKLTLIDINKKALDRLQSELANERVVASTDITNISDADIVIVVTNTPGAIVRGHHLKRGAIAIDCAQPKNVSEQVPAERPDVIVIESAVLRLPYLRCDFDLGIGAREALGCMAETIVLDAVHWHRNFSIGSLTNSHVRQILAAARLIGADLSYFRHSKGLVSEGSLNLAKNVLNG